ncbi:hypothetical protein [Sporisorium scitamineum]|nr:hypothetical protein [Sporisorium scitamineum]
MSTDLFRASMAPEKVRTKRRACRMTKPYSRPSESPGAGKGDKSKAETSQTPTTTVRVTNSQQSKQGSTSDRQSCNKERAEKVTDVVASSTKASNKAFTSTAKAPAASATSRAISTAVSEPKIYQHRAPPGLAFSGPMDNTKNIQRQRRFLVPPGVVRDKQSDFPELSDDLEKGMISHTPGCLECSLKKIHCTYGAGVRLSGKSRDPTTGKCDYCIFTTRKCCGNGYEGNQRGQVGAHFELVQVLDRLDAQVDTCLRAGEEDMSARGNAKRLVEKIADVRAKLATLSDRLSQPRVWTKGEVGGSLSAVNGLE